MAMSNRRRFLVNAGLLTGAAALPTTTATTTATAAGATARAAPPGDAPTSPSGQPLVDASGRVDWSAVRAQFRLAPDRVHLNAFLLSPHPAPVRAEIDRLRRLMDADPSWVQRAYWGDPSVKEWVRLRASLAGYLGGRPEEIAPVPNTTIGLALVYQGLRVRPGQELFVTEHDHFAHQNAVRLAAARGDAEVRVGRLYDDPATVSVDEVAERLRAAITPRTRAVGVTWVQSSTGVKLPVPVLAEVVARANAGRAEADRCLLVVDGVHGLGAEDADVAALGADIFVSGTHKWLFGPRGTGLVWARPDAWAQLRPVTPSFLRRDPVEPTTADDLVPGGFLAFEHVFAVPAAVDFHRRIGRDRVAARTRELSARLRRGLADTPGVVLHTPLSERLSSGLTCFEVPGLDHHEVADRLAERRIRITNAQYRVPYPRLGTGITNRSEDVDRVLAEIRRLVRS
ncbi:aminotransferase class V-fold PLP-dependent enzyme [Saccharothrix australiensis]|uniref:Selenocysteine lyase/cysteine desulfurase n=1 Tax=Saccharothrix australiensis TaxID=2072 RepID=A0A495VZW5_9PSEU|nr:aminotransferase class V-fold PLP-dependent enzyme [Saccharothrix australiensis]RKT54749.1 selenocysteine lyase/cysteine desulfurase [Saccharothrix australiensis]